MEEVKKTENYLVFGKRLQVKVICKHLTFISSP